MVIDLDTLSRRCADGSAKVGDLLREAKILAAPGNFDELAKWVDDELSGYASGRNLSRYRKVSGIPKYSLDGRNWGSLVVEDRRLRDILSTHWLHQPIDEIERYSSLDGSALLPFPPEAIDGSAKLGIKLPSDTAVEITRYEFARVVTDVRNELLRRLLAENPSTSSPPSPSNPIDWDVFICHASEDKDAFVRPLAEALRARGLKVGSMSLL
jgi:AbiTii-like protein